MQSGQLFPTTGDSLNRSMPHKPASIASSSRASSLSPSPRPHPYATSRTPLSVQEGEETEYPWSDLAEDVGMIHDDEIQSLRSLERLSIARLRIIKEKRKFLAEQNIHNRKEAAASHELAMEVKEVEIRARDAQAKALMGVHEARVKEYEAQAKAHEAEAKAQAERRQTIIEERENLRLQINLEEFRILQRLNSRNDGTALARDGY